LFICYWILFYRGTGLGCLFSLSVGRSLWPFLFGLPFYLRIFFDLDDATVRLAANGSYRPVKILQLVHIKCTTC
jgi:hypothetical protein